MPFLAVFMQVVYFFSVVPTPNWQNFSFHSYLTAHLYVFFIFFCWLVIPHYVVFSISLSNKTVFSSWAASVTPELKSSVSLLILNDQFCYSLCMHKCSLNDAYLHVKPLYILWAHNLLAIKSIFSELYRFFLSYS